MIRQAIYGDLAQIAKVHSECFPNSFSTLLCNTGGGYFFKNFIKSI